MDTAKHLSLPETELLKLDLSPSLGDTIVQAIHERNLSSLKEPRGFIKLLQIFLAIFAFATTTSHGSHFTFQVKCPTNTKVMKGMFSYPYRLDHYALSLPLCDKNGAKLAPDLYPAGPSQAVADSPSRVFLEGDYSSAAQFYVAIGVLAFLYALGAVIVYVFFTKIYEDNEKLPMLDFIMTMAFALLWLISTSAWAKNLTDLKYYTNPDHIIPRISDCLPLPGTQGEKRCVTKYSGDFASLNVSIIFGYANLLLWAGNIWFLYKETNWFKIKSRQVPNVTTPNTGVRQQTYPKN